MQNLNIDILNNMLQYQFPGGFFTNFLPCLCDNEVKTHPGGY